MARVWQCERCGRPLGEVGDDGRLRWYDDAVSVAARSTGEGAPEVRLVVCLCGRINPFRPPQAPGSEGSADLGGDP